MGIRCMLAAQPSHKSSTGTIPPLTNKDLVYNQLGGLCLKICNLYKGYNQNTASLKYRSIDFHCAPAYNFFIPTHLSLQQPTHYTPLLFSRPSLTSNCIPPRVEICQDAHITVAGSVTPYLSPPSKKRFCQDAMQT